MNIVVNGDTVKIAQDASVAQLIQQFNLTGKRIAVERNQQIISTSKYQATILKEGDVIEIIHAVGGG